MFQKCGGKVFRPWRDGVVPDDTIIDENKFEIIGSKPKIKKKKIKLEGE